MAKTRAGIGSISYGNSDWVNTRARGASNFTTTRQVMLYLANRARAHSPDAHRVLQAADGYLYLGMADEALAELESIGATEQDRPSVLLARIRVTLHLRQWGKAEALSRRAALAHPEEDEFTVQQAFALHQLEKGDKAVEVLLSAPEWIRRTGILHYNLACYEARLGDLKTARQCINAAIQINAAMRKNARIDPDLQGLWN
jgi:tetratricopeptide (TPR) repeat protein